MPLSPAQHDDVIRTHWPLLWALPMAQRQNRLDQIIADHEQENDLRLVAIAMSSDPALRPAKELDFANLEF